MRMNQEIMVRRTFLFLYLLSGVIGFHNVQVPFASRYLSQSRCLNKASSSCISAFKSNDSQERAVDQWIATSKTVVSTFVLGWSLAASVAMANTDVLSAATVVDELIQSTPEQNVVVNSEEPSLTLSVLGGNVDIVDFSLPSYDEAVASGTPEPKMTAPPSFNPFADFSPEIVSGGENLKAAREEKAAADAAKAEAQAAAKAEAEARKAEDRAAKDARRAEEKAAAEAAKAEKEAAEAAKKAERQAKLEEQREKQRAAVQRQKEEVAPVVVDDSASPPAFEMPDIKVPDFKVPDVSGLKMPDVSGLKMPDVSGLKMPDVSGLKMPDMSALKVPEFTVPEIPKINIPKMEMPSLPESDGSASSSFSAPTVSLPSFEAPKVSIPSVSLPNPFAGGSGSTSSDVDAFGLDEPQSVRDERAREARQVYLDANVDAKEAEAAAKAARDVANEKKKLAAAAKDEACKTRPGGKFLCLRNPFTAGY